MKQAGLSNRAIQIGLSLWPFLSEEGRSLYAETMRKHESISAADRSISERGRIVTLLLEKVSDWYEGNDTEPHEGAATNVTLAALCRDLNGGREEYTERRLAAILGSEIPRSRARIEGRQNKETVILWNREAFEREKKRYGLEGLFPVQSDQSDQSDQKRLIPSDADTSAGHIAGHFSGHIGGRFKAHNRKRKAARKTSERAAKPTNRTTNRRPSKEASGRSTSKTKLKGTSVNSRSQARPSKGASSVRARTKGATR